MPEMALPSRRVLDADTVATHSPTELVRLDLLYVLGVMCKPASTDAAWSLTLGTLLDDIVAALTAARSVGATFNVDNETALDLVGHVSPQKELVNQLLVERVAFMTVGYMLRWIVSRAQRADTRAQASVNAAAATVRDWLATNRIVGGASTDTAKRHWREYRSVSHLWAAWQMVGGVGIDIRSPAGFQRFLDTAQWLLQQGVGIVPHRARKDEAVLSMADAWRLPNDMLAPTGVAIWTDDLDAHDIRKTSLPGNWCKTAPGILH